jgi:hypothetical protein
MEGAAEDVQQNEITDIEPVGLTAQRRYSQSTENSASKKFIGGKLEKDKSGFAQRESSLASGLGE